jgi:hypothetical protein
MRGLSELTGRLTVMTTQGIMATISVMAMTDSLAVRPQVTAMDDNRPARGSGRHGDAVHLVVRAFEEAGWTVQSESDPGRAGLLLRRGRHRYAAALKFGSEARRDRLIPLLAAAILESQAAARDAGAKPLALLSSFHLSEAIRRELFEYALLVAPDVAVGLVDLDGHVDMRGAKLEELDRRPETSVASKRPAVSDQPFDPFSDLNQWMLKVLLARRLPAELLNAPRTDAATGAELAAMANVSAPSASRLLRHLKDRGFLDELTPLRLVRVRELLRQWKAVYVRPPRELKLRWLIPGKPDQLRQALRRYHARRQAHDHSGEAPPGNPLPRACLALFSAADALGFGHVRGVPQCVYLERPDMTAFDALGLVEANVNEPVQVVVRIPRWPHAVFRAAVNRDGLLVSDILQLWLDVSEHPAGGAEQADDVWSRVLRPALEPGDVV